VATRVSRAITTIDAWIHIPLLLEGSELVDLMVIYLIFTSRLRWHPPLSRTEIWTSKALVFYFFLFLSFSSLSLSLYCNFSFLLDSFFSLNFKSMTRAINLTKFNNFVSLKVFLFNYIITKIVISKIEYQLTIEIFVWNYNTFF
jgi:hypothetical protein